MHRSLPATLSAASILLTATTLSAQDRAEKLEYAVTWGYSSVADLKLQRGCPRKGYVPVALTAESNGVAEQIHSFTVRLDSFVSTSGRSLEGRTFIREEGVSRSFKTRFHDDGRVTVEKKFRDQNNLARLTFPRRTDDLLSWWYALRGEKSLKPGKTYTYHVWDGWKLARVVASVEKTERVWTPAGTFEAFRIGLKRTRLHHKGERIYRPKAKTENLGVMWLAEDATRTPVAIDFEAPVGIAKVRLSRAVVSACR